jgi:hypothetical protein
MNLHSASTPVNESTPRWGGWRDAALSENGHTPLWARIKAGIQRLGDFSTAPGEVPGMESASWSLSSKMSSVPRARRLTRARLAAWGLDDLAEIAELVVSELVTNALCHAAGPYRLALHAVDGVLRGEIEDASSASLLHHHARMDDEHGRGLDLVGLLACCWGVDSTPTGKTVWFELPGPGAASSPHL